MKRITEYFLEDGIDFGKYKGHSIKEIYKFVPDYLEWCLINVEKFYVNLNEIKTLSIPTPMRLFYFKFNGKGAWASNISPNANYIKEAYRYIELGHVIQEVEFEFSDVALSIAKEKEEILNRLDHDENDDQDFDYEDNDSTYEKYGGYNDFDDDAIDIAFEGDPLATWNVD